MGPSRDQLVKYITTVQAVYWISTTSGSDYSLCILEVISLCILEVISRVFARANVLPLQQIKSLGYKLISCLFPKKSSFKSEFSVPSRLYAEAT